MWVDIDNVVVRIDGCRGPDAGLRDGTGLEQCAELLWDSVAVAADECGEQLEIVGVPQEEIMRGQMVLYMVAETVFGAFEENRLENRR